MQSQSEAKVALLAKEDRHEAPFMLPGRALLRRDGNALPGLTFICVSIHSGLMDDLQTAGWSLM